MPHPSRQGKNASKSAIRSAHLKSQTTYLLAQEWNEEPVQKQYFSPKKSLKIDKAFMKYT